MDTLIPLIGSIINAGIPVGVVLAGVWMFSRTALGRATIDRLRAGSEQREVVAELQGELDAQRGELVELQERVDFVERMLGNTEDRPALPRETEPTPTPV